MRLQDSLSRPVPTPFSPGGPPEGRGRLRRGARALSLALGVAGLSAAPAVAGGLVNGGAVSGAIDVPGDQDTYTFQALAGEGVQLRLTDINRGDVYPAMWLYGPTGALVDHRSGADVAAIVVTAAASGTHTLIVGDGNTVPDETGPYEIHFTRAPGANEGGALPNGGSVSGFIDLGDLDSYTFDVNAGEGFQLRMADLEQDALYPRMWLYGPTGALVDNRSGANVAAMVQTAAASGTYTLVVGDGNTAPAQTGAYEIHFTRAPGANEGGALPNGSSVVGAIGLGDLDSYTFDVDAGEGFQLRMVDLEQDALYPRMWLYGPTGALVDNRSGAVVAAMIRTAATSGTYTLVVGDGNTAPAQTGAYEIFFTRRPGADEGGTLENGGSVAGSIDLGDIDSYTFDVDAGEGYQLRMVDLDGGAFYPEMWLYGPAGELVDNRSGADVAAMVRTAATSGTYTLVVGDGNTAPTQVGPYEIHYTRAPGANEGGALPNGGSVLEAIGLGDLDSYTFDIDAGEGFQLRMADLDGEALYPRMWLYGPTGALVDNRSGADVAVIIGTAATSGVYTLVVGDGNTAPAQTGPYELRFTRAPGANELGELPNGGVVYEAIDLGDIDSFTFEATAGESFQLRMADLERGVLYPRMWLYGPAGNLVDSRSGADVAAINGTAATSGTYTLVVSDGNTAPSRTGSYALHFTRAPGAGEGGRLIRGRVVLGSITLGDLDSYRLHAAAGEAISIRMVQMGNTSLRPEMRLHRPDGSLLASTSGAGVASIDVAATATGLYTLVVEDGNTANAGTGPYHLRLLPDLGPTGTPGRGAGGSQPAGPSTGG